MAIGKLMAFFYLCDEYHLSFGLKALKRQSAERFYLLLSQYSNNQGRYPVVNASTSVRTISCAPGSSVNVASGVLMNVLK